MPDIPSFCTEQGRKHFSTSPSRKLSCFWNGDPALMQTLKDGSWWWGGRSVNSTQTSSGSCLISGLQKTYPIILFSLILIVSEATRHVLSSVGENDSHSISLCYHQNRYLCPWVYWLLHCFNLKQKVAERRNLKT